MLKGREVLDQLRLGVLGLSGWGAIRTCCLSAKAHFGEYLRANHQLSKRFDSSLWALRNYDYR